MTDEHELPQLVQLFDFLDDVVAWVKDLQGRYTWVNRAFALNYEVNHGLGQAPAGPAGILGKTDYDISPAFLADQFRLDDELVLAGKQIINRIEPVGQPDGEVAWHITNKIPLFGKGGAVIGSAGMTRRVNAASGERMFESGIGRVVAHMRDNYASPLSNRQLAAVAHMSVRAFERKFLGGFHVTPQQYLRKLRLMMASRALVFTSHSLVEVAQGCGFADQSHFTREFRRHFGRTPRHYREYYSSRAGAAADRPKSAADRQAP